MALPRVHIDQAALARVLKSATARDACRRVGERVAENAQAQGIRVGDTNADGVAIEIPLPVVVTDDAQVVLAHPAGLAVQAKHGILTKAAAEAGLEVRG